MAIADAYIYDDINIGINPLDVSVLVSGCVSSFDENNTGVNPLDVPIVIFGQVSSFDESNTGVNPDDTTITVTGRVSVTDESNTGVFLASTDAISKLSAYDEENVIARAVGGTMPPVMN